MSDSSDDDEEDYDDEEEALEGLDEIIERVNQAEESIRQHTIPVRERASVSRGLQYVKSLQDESGGFFLTESSENTSPMMTGYALWTYAICGLTATCDESVSARNYLKSCQGPEGGFPYYMGRGEALTPTIVVANALQDLGVSHADPVLRKATNYILNQFKDSGWNEYGEVHVTSREMDTVLTSLCLNAVGGQLSQNQRAEVLKNVLDSYNKTERGWAAPGSGNTDVDNTVMALDVLNRLSDADANQEQDRQRRINSATKYISDSKLTGGGWSTRSEDDNASMDTTGMVLHIYGASRNWLNEELREAVSLLLRSQKDDGSWADADDMEGDLDSTFFAMQGLISSCGDLVPSSEVSEQLDSLNEYIVENYQAQINDAKDRYKNSIIKKLKIAGGAIATVGTGLYSAWEFLV